MGKGSSQAGDQEDGRSCSSLEQRTERRRRFTKGPPEFREVRVDQPKAKGKLMPARPSHIPHATERTALQRMSLTRGVRPEQMHPAGKQIISGMLAKGWIEKQPDGRTYCITPAGDEALRAIIPTKR